MQVFPSSYAYMIERVVCAGCVACVGRSFVSLSDGWRMVHTVSYDLITYAQCHRHVLMSVDNRAYEKCDSHDPTDCVYYIYHCICVHHPGLGWATSVVSSWQFQ